MAQETPIIATAEVISTVDPTQIGSFWARIPSYGNQLESIYYTSPYASINHGGFIAVPEVGTKILVCQPAGGEEWYYMGATFTPEFKEAFPVNGGGSIIDNARLKPFERVDPRLTRARGFPMRMGWFGPKGSGLSIDWESNTKLINEKVELVSTKNKAVVLTDNPAQDCIRLDSGNGSQIRVTNNPKNSSVPAQAVLIETVGPTQLFNTEDQTDILVKDGKELQLLNNSTGQMAPEGEPNHAGNINIQSLNKDVNIFTKAKKGRIFIECLNADGSDQVIEIQTNGADGAIRIKTNGKVDIDAENIGINAGNNIDINAGGNITMQSGGVTSVKASGNINADGAQIQLNGGLSTEANPSIGESESYYGLSGITTY